MAAKRGTTRASRISRRKRKPVPQKASESAPKQLGPGSAPTESAAARAADPGPLVVGVGGSAGSLSPLRELLAALPADCGIAFVVSADGSAIDLQIVGTSAPATAATPRDIHLALIDVTELRRTERALQAAVAAATLAEERERRKLAADLHDDADQLLSLASLKLHALGEATELERGARMAELEDLLVEIRRRISSLSFQLSPPLLHDVGLIAAVRWLAEDLETSHGLSVKIIEEHELELDENARVTFYRAIRELLLDVVKHAGVKEARLQVSREGGMARIAVEDGGVGMPPRAKRLGFGLLACANAWSSWEGRSKPARLRAAEPRWWSVFQLASPTPAQIAF